MTRLLDYIYVIHNTNGFEIGRGKQPATCRVTDHFPNYPSESHIVKLVAIDNTLVKQIYDWHSNRTLPNIVADTKYGYIYIIRFPEKGIYKIGQTVAVDGLSMRRLLAYIRDKGELIYLHRVSYRKCYDIEQYIIQQLRMSKVVCSIPSIHHNSRKHYLQGTTNNKIQMLQSRPCCQFITKFYLALQASQSKSPRHNWWFFT